MSRCTFYQTCLLAKSRASKNSWQESPKSSDGIPNLKVHFPDEQYYDAKMRQETPLPLPSELW